MLTRDLEIQIKCKLKSSWKYGKVENELNKFYRILVQFDFNYTKNSLYRIGEVDEKI